MSFIDIFILAVGLSMDSLAVSVTSGAIIDKCACRYVIKIAGMLALFQAGLTLIGYVAGFGFRSYICEFDHWIAFGLLLYLGGKMIYESFKHEDHASYTNPLAWKTLCGLGIATSIDALAVGISLALLKTSLSMVTAVIYIVTFLISAAGVLFGNHFGHKVNLKLDLVGGIILIAIGAKILIEHLYFNG